MKLFRRWSIPKKAMAIAAPLSFLVGLLQAYAFAWAARAELPHAWAIAESETRESPAALERFELRIAVAVLFTSIIATASAGLFAFYITRHRSARLARVLRNIAAGDLTTKLEPSIDTDLVVVREALARMQTALVDLTGRLRHTDAQRRRLFADLAHELATPTSAIMGIADFLADDGAQAGAPERARFVGFLEQEASRLGRLVADVRDLAHLDDPETALELSEVDLAVVAREVAERMNAEDAASARISVEADAAPVMADRGRIEQVLINLLGNARRYTPADGAITIALRTEGDEVRLVVEDSGVGVPSELMPRLGERLLRIDPSRSTKTGGHGLGLSIASAVVQRHLGRMSFERASLGGLRVAIALPRAREVGIPQP